ncbi:glycoside hydrolase family 3 protein [Thermothielavioides terrestris NRRL 8126]|uniref:xylan 1,4-beta-xylosidase n=1 Tax=Thermothielavioides terrestris (strain ATCC 38088 / NRRL 8126) TaxID=578455 RepID=G2RCC4_THETT|nr:glycoside hydrolase family 3 protein [Thermothielavioides terrestris NRRL 8126]AEO70559.1 glycoside hydrolase family 3 protein [Thermothielavioides terrestris NRRL 8126]
MNGPLANNTVCDTTASPPKRAAALVEAMNITEKLANLVEYVMARSSSKGAPRLGLPPYEWWSEALHGVAASPGVSFNWSGGPFSYATSFANPITLSAAFDDELVQKVADVISTEARAFANAGSAGLDFWTPNINPWRDPRWGRGSETPGEDPVRIKGYVRSLLRGLEGEESIKKVIATCKHYAAYDLERWHNITRYEFDAIVSLQDLSEYYLPPFQQCARDSKVGSIMCSYNSLNGTPACANTYLMDDILRKHWRWTEDNNYITSDCNAIKDFLPDEHNFTQTAAEAAAAAYTAGTDTVCEVAGSPPYTDVVGAYDQKLLSEEVIDRALRRLYEGLVRAGYFDPASASPYRDIGWSDVNTAEAQALALQSASDGLVLLKNDGTLPIKLEGKTVALIGHWASGTRSMLGGYSGIPPYYHSPVYAAGQLNLTYKYASGPVAPASAARDTWTADALSAANKSDVILYFGGLDQSVASEDKDRDSIAWPPAQLTLIQTLAGLGKPLVVIQLGDQVDDTPLLTNPNVSAILWAGYPGQSGGTAVLNAITGVSPPAGRLPVTQYPSSYTSQLPLTDMSLRPDPASGRPGRTYRWLPRNATVLPFGYGLHYTNFTARPNPAQNFTLTPSALLAPCKLAHRDLCPLPYPVTVEVTNTGARTSDYVGLVFATTRDAGPPPHPLKTLVAYARLRGIAPGRTARAQVQVALGDLARVDAAGNRVLYPGRYGFVLGVGEDGEGEGEGGVVEMVVSGEEVVLDEFPQPRGE